MLVPVFPATWMQKQKLKDFQIFFNFSLCVLSLRYSHFHTRLSLRYVYILFNGSMLFPSLLKKTSNAAWLPRPLQARWSAYDPWKVFDLPIANEDFSAQV